MTVPGEMLTGDKELLVSISVIKSWEPPFEREIIEKANKKQIAANISAALEFLGITHEFD